jgi:hypothetical protein
MSVTVQSGVTIPFDRFWRWLKQHPNCILRAGTHDVWLQLVRGKQLLAEIVLDVREALFVQATSEEGEGSERNFLFEVVGGGKEEPYAVYHFLVAHGFEEDGAHASSLKH